MSREEMPHIEVEVDEDLITVSQMTADSASNALTQSVTILPEQVPWLVGCLERAAARIVETAGSSNASVRGGAAAPYPERSVGQEVDNVL